MSSKLSLILVSALILAFAMSGCSAVNPSANSAPEKTYKIGIVMYQWTDAQGSAIQRFCSYLQANMNVEFVYESTYYNDDAHVGCVENLISAGCNAIISGYDTNLIAALDTAVAAKVYYAVALDHITEDDLAGSAPGTYFVGGTTQFGGDLAALGETYANAVLATDLAEIGGISFPAWAFSDAPAIYQAFQNKLKGAGKNVYDLGFSSGFTMEEVQASAQTVLNDNSNIQALFGMSSGLDYEHIPKFRNGTGKILANASTPDFSGASDIILGYALRVSHPSKHRRQAHFHGLR